MKDEQYSQDFDFVKYTDISDLIQDEQARKNAFAHSPDDIVEDTDMIDEPLEETDEPYDEPLDETPIEYEPPEEEYPEPKQETPVNEEFEKEYEFDKERALEQIQRAKEKRELADQMAKDKLHAEILMVAAAVVLIITVVFLIVRAGRKKPEADTFKNISTVDSTESQEDLEDLKEPIEKPLGTGNPAVSGDHVMTELGGITFIDDIMIVNKTYGLPSTYNPGGLDPEAEAAFYNMSGAAWGDGITLWICSGYRGYDEQVQLFEQYAAARGLDEADRVSARPGHSEHQSGLCIDVNSTDFSFADSAEARWLEQHCAEYGFILRFPKGKELLTGYEYEPWHIRYVGERAALEMKATGKCLEEYLGVTSNYADSPDNEAFLQRYAMYADIHPDDSSSQADNTWTWDGSSSETDTSYDDGNNWGGGYDNTWDNGYDNTWDNGYDNTWDNGYDDGTWYADDYTY